MPASRTIGSSVPSAVVVSASPIISVDRPSPTSIRTKANVNATTKDRPQPAAARLSGLPLISLSSIS